MHLFMKAFRSRAPALCDTILPAAVLYAELKHAPYLYQNIAKIADILNFKNVVSVLFDCNVAQLKLPHSQRSRTKKLKHPDADQRGVVGQLIVAVVQDEGFDIIGNLPGCFVFCVELLEV